MAEEKKKKDAPPKQKYAFPHRKRSGVLLTKEEVKEIKAGRKKLRKELRARGEKSRKEFEITASSLGLYFDKTRLWALLTWFFAARGGLLIIGAALLLLGGMYIISLVTDMKGHFTVSMHPDMFEEGLTICEDEEFKIPTSHLFSTPEVDVPCISIVDIPDNVDDPSTDTGGNYFAYTFYLKNNGKSTVDYQWELRVNSESAECSKATWVMLFVDDQMTLYAEANDDGSPAALPAKDVDNVGYLHPPLYDRAADKEQYEVVKQVSQLTYWRVIPKPFVSSDIVAVGEATDVVPDEVHKYTVVIWLEGDDPQCTEELIGSHIGLEMYMALTGEELEDMK